MKLRIAGNSIRLRLLRSEVDRLRGGERLQEALTLGVDASTGPATFKYALEAGPANEATAVRYADCALTVVLASDRVQQWAGSNEEVGLYDALSVAGGRVLDVMVEKDFACLDLSDAENVDTFPNPLAGTAC